MLTNIRARERKKKCTHRAIPVHTFSKYIISHNQTAQSPQLFIFSHQELFTPTPIPHQLKVRTSISSFCSFPPAHCLRSRVVISHKIVLALTSSPSLWYHLLTLPFVIVGLSFGITNVFASAATELAEAGDWLDRQRLRAMALVRDNVVSIVGSYTKIVADCCLLGSLEENEWNKCMLQRELGK